ncbi:MAG TPA: efflux RND transporter periplasmic adaptor subunit [Phycisphaerae bacterium]|nr:efflux RND transporter periplasmic adaptor subunit [Phycisphaerae bacterium]HRY68384.1 efflux RND transporter periplasmic adaptor subunit [Phycisphaerae bacterium]HSA27801.1 efflux RND transporter periplasmic adaptor subunit [Phycisphaerae bacterium]
MTESEPNQNPRSAGPAAGSPDRPRSANTGVEDVVNTVPLSKPGPLLVAVLFLAGAGALVALFLTGWLPRVHREAGLRAEADRIRQAAPVVNVAKPKIGPSVTQLGLPGNVQAMRETTVCARADGYLKRWFFDIGDDVKEGQLIAEIDTPEIDQELGQAQAAQAQAQARLATTESAANLARTTLERYRSLSDGKAISVQDLAERQAAYDTALSTVRASKADVDAAEANVRRLAQLKSFSRMLAPFDGTVTARYVDIGDLITAGGGDSPALFKIVQAQTVRVFVEVPQSSASSIRPGQKAELTLSGQGDRKLVGEVSRTARAIEPESRTMRTEVLITNKDGLLLPGMYVKVTFSITTETPPLLLPVSALVIDAAGTRVAVVAPDGRLQYKKIRLAGDYGTAIGVASGLSPEDDVVLNPDARLTEGMQVATTAPA